MVGPFRRKCLLFFLAWHVFGLSAPASEIRLRSEAALPGPVVRLADVATIISTAAERVELGRLEAIELGPSPPAGESLVIDASSVREVLELRGVNLALWPVSGAEAVSVRRSPKPGAAPSSARSQAPVEAPRKEKENGKSRAEMHRDKANRAGRSDRPANGASAGTVRPRSPVTVTVTGRGVRVTTEGIALDGGCYGELVRVECAKGEVPVTARVVGNQSVEVVDSVGSRVAAPMGDSRPVVPPAPAAGAASAAPAASHRSVAHNENR